ncbi:hypothetical protein [Microcystis aeruginosa]|uniref:hypothetical protein n=1 Tax=Microcystis aeruginosa TaxID=1126 RepID=UPI00232F23D6|nr:hypothetical protein [Microcystis aeruginosa]MDB9414423.1 hypothetical protein [Microcystis aeruginosa CS-567/02]
MVYRTSAFGLLALALLVSGVSVSASQRMTGVRESQINEGINGRRDTQLLAQRGNVNENKWFAGVLQSCTRAAKSVKCSVVVRSTEDLETYVRCGSGNVTRLFDIYGNVYPCVQIQIGNQKNEGDRSELQSRFPQGTPVKVILTFNNAPSQVNEFDTLELHFYYPDRGFLRFKNIKLPG